MQKDPLSEVMQYTVECSTMWDSMTKAKSPHQIHAKNDCRDTVQIRSFRIIQHQNLHDQETTNQFEFEFIRKARINQ